MPFHTPVSCLPDQRRQTRGCALNTARRNTQATQKCSCHPDCCISHSCSYLQAQLVPCLYHCKVHLCPPPVLKGSCSHGACVPCHTYALSIAQCASCAIRRCHCHSEQDRSAWQLQPMRLLNLSTPVERYPTKQRRVKAKLITAHFVVTAQGRMSLAVCPWAAHMMPSRCAALPLPA